IALLRDITLMPFRRVHVIGGGSLNPYLMQMTADTTALPVVAGPAEGTALGNTLVQIKASGGVSSLTEMRSIVSRSVELKYYTPAETQRWDKANETFESLP
ncbi:MAG: rhamnulokinase, partial [Bacteroidaceae bacterium]|nr:rhamnulokinase [Bacteroidaceae bacterium]